MATTLDDLAREAGVCKMTVSLALRGKGRMAPATRTRIQRLAEERGYRPNASARAVSNGRHGCVALVQSTHINRSYLPRDLLLGIEERLASADTQLLLSHLGDAALENPGTMPRVLREWACDGLLLNYHFGIPEPLVAHVERHAVPVIWVNADLAHDAVRHDEFTAGALATQHLLDLGHRRILYADLNYEVARRDGPLHYSRAARRDGYRDAMASAGVAPEEMREGLPTESAEAAAALAGRLTTSTRPSAIVLHSASSLPALQESLWRVGMRVPQDLSIILPCNADEAPSLGVARLSTVELQQQELGTLAVEMLLQRMAEAGVHLESRTVQPAAVPRDTSAPPPKPPAEKQPRRNAALHRRKP